VLLVCLVMLWGKKGSGKEFSKLTWCATLARPLKEGATHEAQREFRWRHRLTSMVCKAEDELDHLPDVAPTLKFSPAQCQEPGPDL
jgi:hypothetical protein